MAAGDTTADTGGEFIFAAGSRSIDGSGSVSHGMSEGHTGPHYLKFDQKLSGQWGPL